MKWGEPGFSQLLLGGYLGMLTLLWTALIAGADTWKKRFALPRPTDRGPLPRLSILIPARNEALNIAACVRAALATDHPDYEVIVVDDNSTDATAETAFHAAAGDPRFRLLAGQALPEGWAGKPWACQQAGLAALGEHLLFIDADVQLAPAAAKTAASVLIAEQRDLLSAFGSWRLATFWERVAIPVIGWFIRGATDVAAVNQPGRPEAFANGQFILVTRAAWEHVGGHAAVRAEVLDDVRFARAIKQRGLALGLYFAPELFTVRLYRNLGEIVAGYGKNLYEGMDRRPMVAIVAIAFQVITLLAPWVALGVGVLHPPLVFTAIDSPELWLGWVVVVCVLPFILRVRLERVDGRSGWLALTHLLGNLVLAAVLIRAVFTVRTTWKGRVFHDGKALSAGQE